MNNLLFTYKLLVRSKDLKMRHRTFILFTGDHEIEKWKYCFHFLKYQDFWIWILKYLIKSYKEIVLSSIIVCAVSLFSHFTGKTAKQIREGTITSSVLCFYFIWLFSIKKKHIKYCQWNGLTLTICSYNDMVVIPINWNFCQQMLESHCSVIFWEFLDKCFRHIALHTKINGGKYQSTSENTMYASPKGKYSSA